jgi:hypothetical protein
MNISLDVSDFVAFGDAWRRAPDITRQELLVAMTDSDVLLQGELMQSLPAGAGGLHGGGLRGSIAHEERALSDTVIGSTYSPKEYAPYIEGGTKPHRPPIQPLIDWAVAKLGLGEDEAKGAAFAIARTIGVRGTKPNPVWRTVWDRSQAEIRRKFDAAMQRIAVRLAARFA